MTKQEILAHVDHTLLKADADWESIRRLCDEAAENHTASICINPGWVRQAVQYLDGRVPVCTVIGFPLGATSTQAKLAEIRQALEDGCEEFDMVINIGRLKSGDVEYVREEIRALKQAVVDEHVQVDVVRVAGVGREGRVRRVAVARGSQREDLPRALPGSCEEVGEFVRLRAQSAYAVPAGQGRDWQQYSTFPHTITP